MRSVVAELQKACGHPHLLQDFRPAEAPSLARRIAASGKLRVLDELLPRLRAAGQRVLLLCHSNAVRAVTFVCCPARVLAPAPAPTAPRACTLCAAAIAGYVRAATDHMHLLMRRML